VKRLIALALMTAVPAAAAALPKAAERGEAQLRGAVLNLHNKARRQFGVAPVAWNDELAAEAMRHAQYMAQAGIYGHDNTPGRRKKMGENLWRGQRGQFSYEAMVGVMIDEARHFRLGTFPNNSRTGNWSDVGHYTQVVWPTTTEVGCALASSVTTDYFVCRYAPTGNKDGVFLSPGNARLAEGGN
jgi:uncharacterized protein YkwD